MSHRNQVKFEIICTNGRRDKKHRYDNERIKTSENHHCIHSVEMTFKITYYYLTNTVKPEKSNMTIPVHGHMPEQYGK